MLLLLHLNNFTVQIDSDLFLVTEGGTNSRARLIPCAQSTSLKLNDGALHVIEMEHRDAFLRAKVDGVAVYPAKAVSRTCERWLFFSLDLHTNSKYLHTHSLHILHSNISRISVTLLVNN